MSPPPQLGRLYTTIVDTDSGRNSLAVKLVYSRYFFPLVVL